MIDLSHLAERVGAPPDRLAAMPSCGVAHDHFRLIGEGKVLRVPRRQALQGMAPARALARQAAAFARGGETRHAPKLYKTFAPSPDLPCGALLVEEIVGRPPRLPDDLPALAAALAAIHRLPVPPQDEWPPLTGSTEPLRRLLEFVAGRTGLFADAGVDAATQGVLRGQLEIAAAEVARSSEKGGEATALVGVDVHPGNFLIDADGMAVLTDWERAQYGHPAADLAHATLPSSTGWDPNVGVALTAADTARFYQAWERAVGADFAAARRPAFTVARRLVWLRTLTWMAHWRAGGRDEAPPMPADLSAHLDAHARDVLSPARVAEAVGGWRTL